MPESFSLISTFLPVLGWLGAVIFWGLGVLLGLNGSKTARWVVATLSIIALVLIFSVSIMFLSAFGMAGGGVAGSTGSGFRNSEPALSLISTAFLLFLSFSGGLFLALLSRFTRLKKGTLEMLLFAPIVLIFISVLIPVLINIKNVVAKQNSIRNGVKTCDMIRLKYSLPELPNIDCTSFHETRKSSDVGVSFESIELLEKRILGKGMIGHDHNAGKKLEVLSVLNASCSDSRKNFRNCGFNAPPIAFRLMMATGERDDNSYSAFEDLLGGTPVKLDLEEYKWASKARRQLIKARVKYTAFDKSVVCTKNSKSRRRESSRSYNQIHETYFCDAKFLYEIPEEVKTQNRFPENLRSTKELREESRKAQKKPPSQSGIPDFKWIHNLEYSRVFDQNHQYLSVSFNYGAEDINDVANGFEKGEEKIRTYIDYLNKNYLVP